MLVSVLINNYNYAKYLAYCISSVLKQTYKNIEIIVYDDGSADNSVEVLNQYAGKIKIIARPNFGKYASYNQGNAIYEAFKYSTGEIICLLDSDDAFLPEKVEQIVKQFEIKPGVVMVQHKMYHIDHANKRTGAITKNILYNLDILKAIYSLQRVEEFFLPTSCLSFRRPYLEKVLPVNYSKYPLLWSDVRLSRAALFYGSIVTIPTPLGEYRRHSNNDSKKLKDKQFHKNFYTQQYAYFNELAQQHNLPVLNRKTSLIEKGMFYLKLFTTKIPFKVRKEYILNKLLA